MKLVFILISIVLCNISNAQNLYPYLSSSGMWGYFNNDLKPTIEPKFEYAHPLIHGVAAVMKYDLWGYLNEDGKLIINHKYYDLEEPSEGLIAVQNPITMKWGYINYEGKIALKFIYDDAGPFKFDLAPVALNGRYVYINKKGQIRHDGFELATPFNHDGFAAVKDKGGREQYIFDKSGKKYLELPVYHYALPSENFYIKIEYGKYGYVSIHDNSIVIPCQYDMAYQFRYGLAPVRKGGKWGYINKKNEVVINFNFDDASVFSEGLAAVKVGNKKGYIDSIGNFVIEPKYKFASDFHHGVAEVELEDEYIYITNKGIDLIK